MAAVGFLSHYQNGPLPYVHNVLNASLSRNKNGPNGSVLGQHVDSKGSIRTQCSSLTRIDLRLTARQVGAHTPLGYVQGVYRKIKYHRQFWDYGIKDCNKCCIKHWVHTDRPSIRTKC